MSNERIFDDLERRRPYLESHVHSVTRALGFYCALNEIARNEIGRPAIAVTARTGARSLRNICLSSMLISGTALFAPSRRDDDVSFEYFYRHFSSAEFSAYCNIRSRSRIDSSADRERFERDVDAAVRTIIAGYEKCREQYTELSPTRNKAIAHISMEDYKRATVGSIIKLARASSSIYRHIEFVLTGRDVDCSTLKNSAELQVAAITQIEFARRRRASEFQ